MSVFKSYREESRTNWGVTVSEATKPDRDQLQLGCLLRIADATELMAKNFIQLQNDRDMYKRWYDQEVAKNARLRRQVSAYVGIVKKLKQK